MEEGGLIRLFTFFCTSYGCSGVVHRLPREHMPLARTVGTGDGVMASMWMLPKVEGSGTTTSRLTWPPRILQISIEHLC